MPVETETKLVLSSEEYHRIREGGRVIECRKQLNVYLHDPERLGETTGYFRVRYETGRDPVATLKTPAGWEGDARKMIEVERPLAQLGPALFPRPRRWIKVGADLPPAFARSLEEAGLRRLRRLGWMRNLRCVIELPPYGSVELDRSVLPGGEVRYEVEIEHPSLKVHEALLGRVRELAPQARISRTGKFTRFLVASGWSGPQARTGG